MATGDNSAPIRFGGGQVGTTNRELFLDVAGGEILTAFDLATQFESRTTVKSVGGGQRSWRFPKTWKATSMYHTPGVELLGDPIQTGEISITIDDVLVSHTGLSDIDMTLSHFDVRAPFTKAMGYELAKVYDKNIARQLVLAARTAADGPFPGGANITSNTLKPDTNGTYDGAAWISAIRDANEAFYDADVPESEPRYVAVNWKIFDAMKYATDANGNYLVLNRDFHGSEGAQAGGISGRAETMEIDGITVFKTKNTPFGYGLDVAGSNESAAAGVYTKYRADYRSTLAVAFTPMAIATVKIKGVEFESTRDVRRREDFMVASLLCGHGTLRPECAVEIKAAALGART